MSTAAPIRLRRTGSRRRRKPLAEIAPTLPTINTRSYTWIYATAEKSRVRSSLNPKLEIIINHSIDRKQGRRVCSA